VINASPTDELPSPFEPAEPFRYETQPFPTEPVHAVSPLLFLTEQPRRLEHSQVARGGWPSVGEATRKLARGRRPAAKVKREEDLPTGWVRERLDHLVERLELVLGVQTSSTSRMVSSSSTGPMGSQTAMISGV